MERHVFRNTEKGPKEHRCESDSPGDRFEVITYGSKFKGAFSGCKVGKVNCPVLLVNGCDDQNWAVTEYAKDVSARSHSPRRTRVFNLGFDL